MATFNEDVICQGNLTVLGTLAPPLTRSSLVQESLQSYAIPFENFRVHDSLETPLPGFGSTESAISVSYVYGEATPIDNAFFVAIRRYRVVGIVVRPLVVGSDGGGVTSEIRKAPSGTAIASGTLLHTGSADLKGTINTNQTLSLSATSSALDIAIGDAIGMDTTGTMTAARGVVTVLLTPSPSADDLYLSGGTYGTNAPLIRSIDVKAAGALTLRCRAICQLPPEYDDGETVQIRVNCGMVTTVADVSCTIDVEAWEIDKDGTLGAGDLVTTSATTMNSLTFAARDFTITPTGLVGGDLLDVRLTIAVNDGASVTAVIAAIASAELLCDVRG